MGGAVQRRQSSTPSVQSSTRKTPCLVVLINRPCGRTVRVWLPRARSSTAGPAAVACAMPCTLPPATLVQSAIEQHAAGIARAACCYISPAAVLRLYCFPPPPPAPHSLVHRQHVEEDEVELSDEGVAQAAAHTHVRLQRSGMVEEKGVRGGGGKLGSRGDGGSS